MKAKQKIPITNPRRAGQVIVLTGPTSSGKSELAVKLARKLNGEVISADSRQVYKGLNIGSGKVEGKWKERTPLNPPLSRGTFSHYSSPDKGRLGGVFVYKNIPHHCIDFVDPKKTFSAGEFKECAEKAIEDILSRGKLPIICGGTGFYIQAIVDNIVLPKVEPNWKLREELSQKNTEDLFAILEELDQERSLNIDPKNPHRLIRAIEIATALGKVPKINQNNSEKNYQFLQIGIKVSNEQLLENIQKRIKKMIDNGLIEETEKMHNSGLPWKKIYEFGFEYKYPAMFLRGHAFDDNEFKNNPNVKLRNKKKKKPTKEELIEKLITENRQYAKRQITWFKRDKRIKWVKDEQKAEDLIKKFLGRG